MEEGRSPKAAAPAPLLLGLLRLHISLARAWAAVDRQALFQGAPQQRGLGHAGLSPLQNDAARCEQLLEHLWATIVAGGCGWDGVHWEGADAQLPAVLEQKAAGTYLLASLQHGLVPVVLRHCSGQLALTAPLLCLQANCCRRPWCYPNLQDCWHPSL